MYNDSENMYLIGEDLILKNEVIGRYDGKYVKDLDPHQRYTFYHNTVKEWGKEEDSYKIVATPDGNQYFEVKFAHPTGDSKNSTDVDATLAGVYDTDYFSGMTDIDEFLKNALES